MHDFKTDKDFSNEAKLSAFIDKQYFGIFPHLKTIEIVTDIDLQRKGVDKKLIFTSGKCLYIDEKIRRTDYGDILLEEYSNKEKKIKGWLNRDKYTDYISYIVLPREKLFLFPFISLQLAWITNYKTWLGKYGSVSAKNPGHTTTNIPVPTDILLDAIKDSIVHNFEDA